MSRRVLCCLLVLIAVSTTTLFALAAPRTSGVKYALLIGVRDYLPAELRNLFFTDNDISDLAKVLIERGGYRAEHVIVMTQKAALDQRKPQLNPMSANIRKQLKDILALCEEEDSLLIAFAGHGLQFKGDPNSYFCPADARLSDKTTLISLEELYRLLGDRDKCKAHFKLLLVDACRNHPRTAAARARDEVELEGVTRPRRQAPPGGVAAFFSCSAEEKAYEDENLKHGVFFHFVIKGLQGEAADRQGVVTLPDLEKYVKLEVKTFVHDQLDTVQRPEMVNKTNDVVELVRRLIPPSAVAPFDAAKAKELQHAWARYLGRKVVEEVDLGGGIRMEIVLIPPGKFLMGSPKDEKDRDPDEEQHEVEITRPFYLGKYEVTRGQFRQFFEDADYKTEAETDGRGGFGWNADTEKFEQNKDFTWKKAGFVQTDAHPVVNVSWNDAQRFCRWLSGKSGKSVRLPSEAEWEYACRAGTTTRFYSGDDAETLAGVGNVADATAKKKFSNWSWTIGAEDGYVFTAPVGQFKPNQFGLHDTHGNVWEWCQDYYGPYKDLAVKDPLRAEKVDKSARVTRGGAWYGPEVSFRTADRNPSAPGDRGILFGFRVAFRLD